MQFGYLFVETHDNRPGVLRIGLSEQAPEPDAVLAHQPRIRYIARFNDSEAALMQTHELLKRRLLDADTHLYRAEPPLAIAAIESLDLKHGRMFLDPQLDAATQQALEQQAERFRQRKKRMDRFFQILGYIGIGLLLLHILLGSS